jgi:hypothetical protein
VPVQQPSQEQPAEVCLDAPAGPAPAAAPTGRCHLDLQIVSQPQRDNSISEKKKKKKN